MLPLLHTKTSIPPTSPKQIRRERLLERVAQGAQRALALIVAPAGFGKTSLAAAWAQEAHMPVAWLSLQPADRPRARFLAYLIQALQRAAPQLGQTSLALMQAGAPEGALFALVNDLAEHQGALALVLDDYHSADSPETAAVLQFLLEHRPAGFHLLITSRAAPGLNLARLRAQDQVIEIGTDELRFREDEVRAFLETSLALHLPPEALVRLNQSTEGWAVGLQLAALALARQPEQWQSLAGQEHIFEYLAEEVLRREPPEVQAFLRSSALFDRFCAPLLEHVSPSGRAEEWIETVERANLFLVPLDAEGGWYRYHALFTDFLRRQTPAEQAGPLYRAASEWCEANGLLDDSIHYAVHAADFERAAGLLESHYIDMVKRGEQAALAEWIAALPPDLREQRPRLWLALGWASVISFDAQRAEACIARAEALIGPGADGDRLRGEARALGILSAIFSGNAAAAGAIDDAGDLGEQDDFLHSLLHFNLGLHHVMHGQTARAVEAFGETLRLTAELNYPLVTIVALAQLGETRLMRGALGLAERTYQQAMRYTRETLGEHTFLLGIPYISYAELLREQNRFDEARRYAEQGIAFCRVWQPIASMDGEISTARMLAAEGRWEEAYAGLEQAMQVAEGSTSVLDDTFIAIQMARLALLEGDLLHARQVIQAYELDKKGEGVYYHLYEMTQMLLLRARIAELGGLDLAGDQATAASQVAGADTVAGANKFAAISAALAALIAEAERRERVTPVIEALILRAYAERAAGERDTAAECLSRALALGAQSGYARLFADEGAPLLHLLEEIRPRLHAPRSYLEHILDLLGGGRAPANPAPEHRPGPAPAGLTPLTRRELEILQHMAAGMSNQEIAAACVLSLNTVKKHVANILSKLGAANRTQAVQVARQAGWIM